MKGMRLGYGKISEKDRTYLLVEHHLMWGIGGG